MAIDNILAGRVFCNTVRLKFRLDMTNWLGNIEMWKVDKITPIYAAFISYKNHRSLIMKILSINPKFIKVKIYDPLKGIKEVRIEKNDFKEASISITNKLKKELDNLKIRGNFEGTSANYVNILAPILQAYDYELNINIKEHFIQNDNHNCVLLSFYLGIIANIHTKRYEKNKKSLKNLVKKEFKIEII